MTFTRTLQPGLAARCASSLPRLPWPHRGPPRTSRGDRVGRLQHTLPDPASFQGRGRVGRENSHASHRKKVPIKGHGAVQDVAVLEDTARGQSACLEFASSSCNTSDAQKTPTRKPQGKHQQQGFPRSSPFLLFSPAFAPRVDWAPRQPKVSEQGG